MDVGNVPTLGSEEMQFLTDFNAVYFVQNLECTRLVSSCTLFTAWLHTIVSVY